MVEYIEKEQAINIVDKILQNNKVLLLGERIIIVYILCSKIY